MSILDKKYTLYYLSSSEDDTAFYIGLSTNTKQRLASHRKNKLTEGKNIFRYKKVKEIAGKGFIVNLTPILTGLSKVEANIKEVEAITLFRYLGFSLTNILKGGIPVEPINYSKKHRVFTEEHRTNISLAKKGKKLSPESIAKREATKKANGTNVHPPEVVAKIAAKLRGRKIDPAIVEKTAAVNRGKKRTIEQRNLTSARHKGRVHSAETKAKMSESRKQFLADPMQRELMSKRQIGRVLSAETRAKIAAAHLGKTRTSKA